MSLREEEFCKSFDKLKSMKNRNNIRIPNQRRYQSRKKGRTLPKSLSRREGLAKTESVELGTIQGYDTDYVSRRINAIFHLADLQESLIRDVESEIQKADKSIQLPLRHSIERIKVHTRDMVAFVDKVTSPEFAENFGEQADRMMEWLREEFLAEPNDIGFNTNIKIEL